MARSSVRWIVGIAAAAILGNAVGAAGQPGRVEKTTPEQRAAAQTAFMKEKLDLSPEQLAKVEALNLTYAKKMEPVLTGSEGPLVKMGKAKEINEQKDAELKTLLSEEQFAKYRAAQEEMRKKVIEDFKSRKQ